MESEKRKATDLLLDLESKVDALLALVRSQDLVMKLLSNKLNSVMESINNDSKSKNNFKVEAINTLSQNDKNVKINAEASIPITSNPNGFSRNARQETYSGDNSFLNKPVVKTQEPVVIPKKEAPVKSVEAPVKNVEVPPPEKVAIVNNGTNTIAVNQRIVDANGKSIFLANVEVFNLENNELVYKTRTNSIGKWSAPLSVGTYKVIIKKMESASQVQVKSEQQITVDGSESLLELKMIIIR